MHENGAEIRMIQAVLEHAKLETTEIYTIKQLQEVHAATHPAARIGKRKEGVEPEA
jgi:integrase/recombinase XerD